MENLRVISSNRIGGILVPFSTPENDSYNTFWDSNTDFGLDVFAPHPVLYLHGLRGVRREGTIVDLRMTEQGLYAEAELNDDSPLFDLIRSGRGAWSSASVPHLISQDDNGYISKWVIVEGSIGDVQEVSARNGLTRADYVRADVNIEEDTIRSEWIRSKDMSENVKQDNAIAELRTVVTDLTTAVSELRQDMERPAVQLEAEDHLPIVEPAPSIRVASPYDNVDLLGMAFHHEANVLRKQHDRSWQYSLDETFMRAMVDKIRLAHTQDEDKYMFAGGDKLRVAPMRAIDTEAYNAWNSKVPYLRADEAMGSTLAGFGDELVSTILASTLYYYVRLESRVWSLFPSFMMPSQPYNMPKITSSPVFYSESELADQDNFAVSNALTPTSRIGTSDVTFSAGKASALVLYTREQMEDSNVNFSQAVATELAREMAHTMDWIAINGDETASASNISWGVNPSGVAGYDRALVMDGLRHMSLIDDSGSDAVAIATLADTSLITLMKLMGSRGKIGRDISNLVCIVPPEVAYLIDEFSEYETLDSVGSMATLLTGQVGVWRGVPVLVSEDIELTDATGLIDNTVANNTKGSALLVNKSGIMTGIKRNPIIEQTSVPGTDGEFVRVSFRADIQQMEQGFVAHGYNMTV